MRLVCQFIRWGEVGCLCRGSRVVAGTTRIQLPHKKNDRNMVVWRRGLSRPIRSGKIVGDTPDESDTAGPARQAAVGAGVSLDAVEPALSVAAVATGWGITPATPRTWDRRYGVGPSGHAGTGNRGTPGRAAVCPKARLSDALTLSIGRGTS